MSGNKASRLTRPLTRSLPINPARYVTTTEPKNAIPARICSRIGKTKFPDSEVPHQERPPLARSGSFCPAWAQCFRKRVALECGAPREKRPGKQQADCCFPILLTIAYGIVRTNICAAVSILEGELLSAADPQPNPVTVPGTGSRHPCRDDVVGYVQPSRENSSIPSSRQGLAGPGCQGWHAIPHKFSRNRNRPPIKPKHLRGCVKFRGGIA